MDSTEQQPLACSSPDDVLLSSTGLDLFPMSDDEYQPAFADPNVAQGIENVCIGCPLLAFNVEQ